MPNDAFKLTTVTLYLRRKYYSAGSWDVTSLKALADTAYGEASEQVTITSTASEAGGAATGTVTFDKAILLLAIENLLLEVDPDNTPPPPAAGGIPDFSQRFVQT